jgi:hypothetical protein
MIHSSTLGDSALPMPAPHASSMTPPTFMHAGGGSSVPSQPPAAGSTTWPKIIGILSIVFGSLGVLMHAFLGVTLTVFSAANHDLLLEFGAKPDAPINSSIPMLQFMTSNTVVMAAGTLLLTLWSIFLIVAGVQLLRHRPVAIALHVAWAIGKLFFPIMVIVPMLLMFQGTQMLISRLAASDSPDALASVNTPAVSTYILMFYALGLLAIAWSYPIFLLAWFSFRKLK